MWQPCARAFSASQSPASPERLRNCATKASFGRLPQVCIQRNWASSMLAHAPSSKARESAQSMVPAPAPRSEIISIFSATTTDNPCSAAERAAATPARPAPITSRSHSMDSTISVSAISAGALIHDGSPDTPTPPEVDSSASDRAAGEHPARAAPPSNPIAPRADPVRKLRRDRFCDIRSSLLLCVSLLRWYPPTRVLEKQQALAVLQSGGDAAP